MEKQTRAAGSEAGARAAPEEGPGGLGVFHTFRKSLCLSSPPSCVLHPAYSICVSAETERWSRGEPLNPERGPHRAHPAARAGPGAPSGALLSSVRVGVGRAGAAGHVVPAGREGKLQSSMRESCCGSGTGWARVPVRSAAQQQRAEPCRGPSLSGSDACVGTGLETLPLSFRLRSLCCETPTALPDSSERQTPA